MLGLLPLDKHIVGRPVALQPFGVVPGIEVAAVIGMARPAPFDVGDNRASEVAPVTPLVGQFRRIKSRRWAAEMDWRVGLSVAQIGLSVAQIGLSVAQIGILAQALLAAVVRAQYQPTANKK